MCSRRELTEAFEKIRNGYKPPRDEWYRYLAAVEELAFPAVNMLLEQYGEHEDAEHIKREIMRLGDRIAAKLNSSEAGNADAK